MTRPHQSRLSKSITFINHFTALEVIKGVSMTAYEGDIISIIGASGSGKSTFLRCLNLLENPTAGNIEINGDMMPANRRQIERLRTQLGVVFQGFNLWGHMTVLQNLIEAPHTRLEN